MSESTLNSAEQHENKILMTAMGIMVAICIVLAILGFCFLDKPNEIIEGQAQPPYA